MTNIVAKKEVFKEEIKGSLATKACIFDGYNVESKIKGSQKMAGGYVQRYETNYDGGFSFLGDFMRNLEKAFNVSIESQVPVNYVFPVKNDIDLFIKINKFEAHRYQISNHVLNSSEDTVKTWAEKISESIQQKYSNPKDRVRFIASKVGSGKTTFVNYFLGEHAAMFLKNDIVPVRINYTDFLFDKHLDDDIDNYIKELITSQCVISYLSLIDKSQVNAEANEFIEKLNLSDTNLEAHLLRIIDDNIDNPAEKAEKLNKIETCSIEGVCESSLTKYFKFLSRARVNPISFLIIIDGFDILNPSLIERQKIYIDRLKRIIFNDINQITVYYIVSLRSCTYEFFKRDNTEIKYLVSPADTAILESAIDIVAKTNNFIKNRKDIFMKLFTLILDQLSKIFALHSHNLTLIQVFDYNYRFLLRYLEQVLYCILHEYTSRYPIDNIDELADIISRNDYKGLNKTLETKWYIILDILLLKAMPNYELPYKAKTIDRNNKYYLLENSKNWGKVNFNKDITSFIDNIYNYILTEDMVSSDTLFPLLYKFRILQIYEKEGNYIDSSIVLEKLFQLGYVCDYFESVLNDLHNAKFLKVICTDNKTCINSSKKYFITNRGRITINELALSSSYLDNIIPHTRLPDKNNIVKPVSPYLAYKKSDFVKADRDLLSNFCYFLNVIRCIEDEEWDLCDNDQYFSSFFISNKILENYIPTFEKRIRINENDDETTVNNYFNSLKQSINGLFNA